MTSTDRLLLLVRKGTVGTDGAITFLRHLMRHVRGRIVVLWDNLNIHRAAVVRDFVHAHRNRLVLEYLPPYAPT